MLELRDICVDAQDNREILKKISLRVEPGKLIALTGPNGGGKSTLAKVIAGILKPNSGSVFLDGNDITNASVTERARMGIGFAFQQPVRFKGLTVRDLITLAAGEDISVSQMCDYLRDVGLCAMDYIDRAVDGSLSGGEMKRIEIATVIARASRLIVFDEPEAGIDLWSFTNLIDVFKQLRSNMDGSIVIISHQERILEIADEIIVLADGAVILHGPCGDILPQLLGQNSTCRFCQQENGSQRRMCR